MEIIFERYVIAITAFICFIYSPMIGYFAYRTQQFNHSSLQPDFALTILSTVMLISSISNIICAYKSKLRGLLLLIYVNIMLVVFQLVFVIAMIIFSNDLKQYVNKYFGNQTS